MRFGASDSGIRAWGLVIFVREKKYYAEKNKYMIGQSYRPVAPKKVGAWGLGLGALALSSFPTRACGHHIWGCTEFCIVLKN